MTYRFTLIKILILAALTSCNLAPKYHTPTSPVRLEKIESTPILWQDFFASHNLQKIIHIALKHNQDLKIAHLRIKEGAATHNIAKSNLLPTINASSSATRQGAPSAFAAFTPDTIYRANLSLSAYEIDFFGRLENIKKSALQDFLSTKESKNIIQISLISQVTSSYINFLSNKKLLQIASKIVDIQQKKYDVEQSRYNHGMITKARLITQENALRLASINQDHYHHLVQKDKNALMLLTGLFDDKLLPLDSSLDNIKINQQLLISLPSTALLSRPDIKKAEYALKKSNANIGAARAAFFPSINLTGNYGYSSTELSNLLPSRTWSFTPHITMPIFNAGRNMSNLKIAKIRKKIEIIHYEKAIQSAFIEVQDSLTIRKLHQSKRQQLTSMLTNHKTLYNIEKSKLNAGISTASALLDSQLTLLQTQQEIIITKNNSFTNAINLFKALGGK